MARVTEAHIEARRQSIIDAACRTFADRGPNATMAEIAEQAGLSAGALYRYFDSKDKLAAACFLQNGEVMARDWGRQVDGAADARQAFDMIALQSFREIDEPGASDITRIMIEGLLSAAREPDTALARTLADHQHVIAGGLKKALDHMQAAGQLPEAVDSTNLGISLLAYWWGVRLLRLIQPDLDIYAVLRSVAQLFDAAANTPGRAEALIVRD